MRAPLLTARVAGLAGIVFVVAVAAPGFATGSPPDPGDPAAKWLAYYQDHHSALVLVQLLGLIGTFFAFFYFAKLITVLRRSEGETAPLTVAAVIAIATVATLGAVGSVLAGAAAFRLGGSEHVDAVTLQAVVDASSIAFAFLGLPLAAFFTAAGLLMRASSRLPAWLGVAYLVGAVPEAAGSLTVLSSTGQFSPNGAFGLVFGLLPLGLLTLATSIMMVTRPVAFGDDAPAPSQAAPAAAAAG